MKFLGIQCFSTNNEARIWNKSITRNPANSSVNRVQNGAWEDYEAGDMVISPEGNQLSSFGPEIQIARRWADEGYALYGNKQIHIVKCAVGGTTIYPGSSSADTDWSSHDGQLKELALDYFIRPAMEALRQENKVPKCIGIVWGQGESDATNGFDAQYQAELTTFLNDIRYESGFLDAKILIMELSNHLDGNSAWDSIKSSQSTVAGALSSAELIVTDGSDGETEIGRFLSSLGAGTIHYSGPGILTLGNKYYDALDFAGSYYTERWDYSLYGGGLPFGANIDKTAWTTDETYAKLQMFPYPTSTGSLNSLTWVRDAGLASRPNLSVEPAPCFTVNALNGASDQEIIFSMIHDGDGDTKPGIFIRSDYDGSTQNPGTGYLAQVRDGGGTLTIFERTGGNFVAMNGSPVTPSQSPAAGELYWYRVTMIGNTLKMYNSPNGLQWTEQFSATSSTHASGNTTMTLFNGEMTKSIGGIRASHCGRSKHSLHEIFNIA